MNKYLKYFLVLPILLFSNFMSSTVTSNEADKIEVITVPASKNQTLVITKYPKSQTENVSKKLDSVFKRINKRHDFHGSILVAKNGKLIYNNTYGYADFGKKTKLDKNSIFQLASVSKQFTAAAILILFEQEKLKLDDFVVKFFPEFPYKEITIQHLLNHTSGLSKYFWLAEHKWNKEKAPVNSEMMNLISEHNLPLFFKPGSRFDYSNTGYFVLASLVEKISNKDYSEFLETNIFKPLQMDNSFVYRFEQDLINENQLSGYRLYKGWRHIKISGTVNDAVTGDKNVYSTTEDLLKWINGLNSGKIISKNTLDKMYTKGKTKYGREIPYGFGFRIDDKNSEKIIYHNGKWNGFSTSLKQYIDSDLVIITLEHSNYKSINKLNSKIKSIVDENFTDIYYDESVVSF